MGAWATGINMGVALERNGVVKNTGPDLDKILHTLEFLGSHRRYLMCGYPPFLKHVIDSPRARVPAPGLLAHGARRRGGDVGRTT